MENCISSNLPPWAVFGRKYYLAVLFFRLNKPPSTLAIFRQLFQKEIKLSSATSSPREFRRINKQIIRLNCCLSENFHSCFQRKVKLRPSFRKKGANLLTFAHQLVATTTTTVKRSEVKISLLIMEKAISGN